MLQIYMNNECFLQLHSVYENFHKIVIIPKRAKLITMNTDGSDINTESMCSIKLVLSFKIDN